MFLDDDLFWHDIGQFRRSLQWIANDQLIFIDEIAIYFDLLPRKTRVAPDQQLFVVVKQPSAYPINGSQSIACMTLSREI